MNPRKAEYLQERVKEGMQKRLALITKKLELYENYHYNNAKEQIRKELLKLVKEERRVYAKFKGRISTIKRLAHKCDEKEVKSLSKFFEEVLERIKEYEKRVSGEKRSIKSDFSILSGYDFDQMVDAIKEEIAEDILLAERYKKNLKKLTEMVLEIQAGNKKMNLQLSKLFTFGGAIAGTSGIYVYLRGSITEQSLLDRALVIALIVSLALLAFEGWYGEVKAEELAKRISSRKLKDAMK